MMTAHRRTLPSLALAGLLSFSAAQLGCSSGSSVDPPRADTAAAPASAAPRASGAPAAAATLAAPIATGVPIDPDLVAKVVNPKNEPAYSGPTGTLRGKIRVQGDPPPDLPVKLPEGDCRAEAAITHGKLFRVGQGGALADALVAVTGYKGYVPASDVAKRVTIHGCSLSKRTVVATFGQRIEVSNIDKIETYMPYLDGGPTGAILVAIPGGDAVRLYPPKVGHYKIRDQLPHDYMTAEVYVLAYATLDSSGLDGGYEIKGIPVGPVEVNAMLPATNKSAGQRFEIKEGDNTLDLTITFDAKNDYRPEGAEPAKDEKGAASAKAPGPKG